MISGKPIAQRGEVLSNIARGAIPVGLFIFTILIRIPPVISRALSAYSFPYFLIVLVLYYLSYRAPGRIRWPATTGLTMLLLGLSLSFLWNSGFSDDKIIGGLIPFRDGFDYYNGANWILNGQSIKIGNEGAAWRPLYPAFLSAVLWITGRNLQWAIAIQVGLAGLSLSTSAWLMRKRLGAPAAALYMTVLYFYIQPLIGTTYTETLGLALGCLGFVLLWAAAETRRAIFLIAGLIVLMIAVSARAGTFFIFPALVVWAGWAWRAQGGFSFRFAGIALVTTIVTFSLVNPIFSRLVVEPGGYPFGNFAFTIYGQVVGGAGYHKAFEDLGIRNPIAILRAAQAFFVAHPASFLIGSAKAYRDFFSPAWGIHSLGLHPLDLMLSMCATGLLLYGVYRSLHRTGEREFSFLLAAFLGIILSVPFLPPIDGGIRIYASTMPFVYAFPAIAIAGFSSKDDREPASDTLIAATGLISLVIAALMIAVPLMIRYSVPKADFTPTSCQGGQIPYAVEVSIGSYIELVPNGASSCGRLPLVCLSQFKRLAAANDPSDMAVFNRLGSTVDGSSTRVFVANDLISLRPHVFLAKAEMLSVGSTSLVLGCATEIQTKGRPSIYDIQWVSDAIPFPVH